MFDYVNLNKCGCELLMFPRSHNAIMIDSYEYGSSNVVYNKGKALGYENGCEQGTW